MKCQKDLLELYLDNRLGEADKVDVESHLGGCSICRGELERLQVVVAMLKTCEPPDLDENFLADVMNAIEALPSPLEVELARRQRVGRFLGFGSSILALGLIIAVLMLFGGYLGAVVWDGIIWLSGIIMLVNLPMPDLLSVWGSIRRLADIVSDVISGNQFLLPLIAVSGLLVVNMTREIVDDVQQVLGYRK
ncbi:MAG TPA: zf-HC2 domain-containing protein [Candidatus Deferrimicrobium sp.]|nr:zf-HC2 domain-containing protein [Candidatus Deferrimicrobium sp.]